MSNRSMPKHADRGVIQLRWHRVNRPKETANVAAMKAPQEFQGINAEVIYPILEGSGQILAASPRCL